MRPAGPRFGYLACEIRAIRLDMINRGSDETRLLRRSYMLINQYDLV